MTSRTPQQQREYMRTYMRDRRASRRTARIFDHAHRVTASSFDIGNRHELRDGPGALRRASPAPVPINGPAAHKASAIGRLEAVAPLTA